MRVHVPAMRRIDKVIQSLTRPIRNHAMRERDLGPPSFNERSVEYAFTFGQMATRAPGKLLDVGSGKSAFPALARMAGWQTEAVDNVRDFWPPGPLGLRWGLFNEHFFVQNIDLATESKASCFEIVTCLSTFEHVHQREALFAGMCRALQPGGLLILTTPYRHKGGTPNAYDLPGSDAYKSSVPYKCQVMDGQELSVLLHTNGLELAMAEYWRFYDSEFWSVGNQVSPPDKVRLEDSHQLACFALHKPRGSAEFES